MTGLWRRASARPSAGGASPRRAWLAIRRERARGGAVRRPGARADDRLAHAASTGGSPALGPDILAPRVRRGRASCAACARTTRRARSATRCSTSARSPASATCGRSRAASRPRIDPWRPAGEVSDDEALAIVARAPPADAARPPRDGQQRRTGRSTAAPGCRARAAARAIRARGQGDDNRTTYWCPRCQALSRGRPQGRRPRSRPATRPRASTRRSRTAST